METENENGLIEREGTTEVVPEFVPEEPPKKKKSIGKIIRNIILVLLIFFLGTAVGGLIVLNMTNSAFDDSADSVMEELTSTWNGEDTKLSYIIQIIKAYYYKDVDDQDIIDGIYKGVLESLDDPYSAYYTAEEYQDLMVSLTGDYAGIGALLSKNADTGVVTITKVYEDTPAEAAGLQAGDIIIAADEYQATDEELDSFVQHVRGEAGTDVTLTIERDGEEMEIVATRDNVVTPTVEYQMIDEESKTGYIQISQFTNGTYDDFVEAFEDLESQGMTQVIFDLRSNGGGLLDSVEQILDYILPEGITVYTMDKYGNREDAVSDAENYKSLPITVLVDGNTASAAEIFTGAIRDYDYGTIIGTKTFGKGIVQSTIPFSDGSALKLTTNSYYTPSGECIQGIGIEPDIELEYEFLGGEDDEYSVEYDNQIQKALEVLGVK